MDINFLLLLATGAVLGLGLGIYGFIGDKAEAYSPQSFSTRMLLIGVISSIMLFIVLTQPASEKTEYLISYIFLFLGILVLIVSAVFISSRKATNRWWRLVRRKEQDTDRRYLIFVTLLLGFGFLFMFFLFYPPFISIG